MRKLKVEDKERVETGAVQYTYGDGYEDWPGTFIRGDHAMYYRMVLERVLECLEKGEQIDPFTLYQIKGLQSTLGSCVLVPG
jgi:hypothetical protein